MGWIGFVVAVSAGCGLEPAKAPLSYTEDAKRAYDEAMREFNSHNWIAAQSLLHDVKRKYSYSKYARLAELRLADADLEQEKYADAIREYREFVRAHRSEADEVEYARSKIAEATVSEIPDSFLLPAGEERDQASVVDAYRELKGYLSDYPDSKESPHVRVLLAQVLSRLVKHELYVGRFYLAKDNYDAAVSRIQYALRTYGAELESTDPVIADTPNLEAEALLLLGTTYLKMHKFEEATHAFQSIVRDFARSPFAVPARRYLEHLKGRGA
jgi:outer membrane protein assembly factor BamD